MSGKHSKRLCLFAIALSAGAGAMLSGCASTTVDESTFFVDPARYALYDCKQLTTYRASYAKQVEELKGLMAKAEAGAAGPIVAEMAYRPSYVSAQAHLKSINATWQQHRCDNAEQSADPSFARPSPGMEPTAGRSRSRVY